MKELAFFCLLLTAFLALPAQENGIALPGLQDRVEIMVDEWGVPHIYAKNEADLFFAQGYYAARDRLFQFELWRRQATGATAEILGARELKRDIGARLFRFRGDMKKELNHYHPRGELIITAFVKGVNAYIEQARKDPRKLPPEFRMLGIQPEFWTPEVVISRHQGLLGNIAEELSVGRLVAQYGAEKVREWFWFHPGNPDLTLDPAIDPAMLKANILELYQAFRRPLTFSPQDLVASVPVNNADDYRSLAMTDERELQEVWRNARNDIGSNNWLLSGEHSISGYPMLANDPHRQLAAPSLRYMAHLQAPGWNVIGGGEPTIPGISIGHNEYGAWGLTVFTNDSEDLYVYQTNPADPNQYRYNGGWESMRIIKDTIRVKGQQPVVVELKYTRHGPVVFEDSGRRAACAVRCGWLEIGGAPYLASLRMNQAKNWEEFRQACIYSHIPGENMIWADRAGNIGWQAVGIAPVRRQFSGMVPVPGDGRFEWDGYLPMLERPNRLNPPGGILVTANENLTPPTYPHLNTTIAYSWADPYRSARAMEYLRSGRRHTLMDMMRLQTDYLSIPARTLTPLVAPLKSGDPLVEKARLRLLDWDFRLVKQSATAAIYNAWEERLRENIKTLVVPEAARQTVSLPMKRVIDWLLLPDGKFGDNPTAGRDSFVMKALREAVSDLRKKQGADLGKWSYGAYKKVLIKHPLSNALKDSVRTRFDVGPEPRGGNGSTVNNTAGGSNQTHGATFRIIVDTGDWDATLATNSPGQSGDPDDKHYRNLFPIWVNDQYFPLFYSRKKIESVKDEHLFLVPAKN